MIFLLNLFQNGQEGTFRPHYQQPRLNDGESPGSIPGTSGASGTWMFPTGTGMAYRLDLQHPGPGSANDSRMKLDEGELEQKQPALHLH